MNGIENILKKISDDTEKKINTMVSQAKSQAEEIIIRYRQKALNDSKEIISNAIKEAELLENTSLKSARLDAENELLNAKHELISSCFELAHKKLLSLHESKYLPLLLRLVNGHTDTHDEVLILSEKDRALYGQKLISQLNGSSQKTPFVNNFSLSEKTRDISGGVVLENGRMEINCSLENLLAVCYSSFLSDVSKILFRKEEQI